MNSRRSLYQVTVSVAVACAAATHIFAAAVPDLELNQFLDQRIGEWALRADEKRFDQIGWASDIREAKRLAKQSGRPVFLFTHDGRINLGRC